MFGKETIRTGLAGIMLAALLTGIAITPAGAEDVLQIRSSSGAKLRSLLTGNPATARANIILLVGGRGMLKISGKGRIKKPTSNFLARTRQLFADAGYLTALVDAPIDRRRGAGLLGGFRASGEHGRDLSKIAKKLHAMNSKSVFVVGTSRGTVSAANLALNDSFGFVKGAVLTSSLVKPNKKGRIITDLELGKIAVPLLFVHNKGDKCKVTRLSDVKPIVKRLQRGGARVQFIVLRSDKKSGGHCRGRSPHGFFGIEAVAVNKIIEWISATN